MKPYKVVLVLVILVIAIIAVGIVISLYEDGSETDEDETKNNATAPVSGNNATVPVSGNTSAASIISNILPRNIDFVKGWRRGSLYVNQEGKVTGPEQCRQLALANNEKYAAWGYRTPEHSSDSLRNTCFLYTSDFGPYDGNINDKEHTTGCLNPGELVKWGCKTTEPAVSVGGVTSVQLCNPWRKKDCKRAGDVLTCDEYKTCYTEHNQSPCAGEEWYEKCK